MSESSGNPAVEEMSPGELESRRKGGDGWQLLDVREPWERDIASIEGSLHIPMGEIMARHQELDAAAPVAVICHSGVRSRQVAEWLAQGGYAPVANISGGIDAWSREVDDSIPRY